MKTKRTLHLKLRRRTDFASRTTGSLSRWESAGVRGAITGKAVLVTGCVFGHQKLFASLAGNRDCSPYSNPLPEEEGASFYACLGSKDGIGKTQAAALRTRARS
jgi:hypothetical protein